MIIKNIFYKLAKKIFSKIKILILRSKNVKISFFSFVWKVKFEGYNKIYRNCKIEISEIGLGTYIAEGGDICRTKIKRFCSIGPNLKTIIVYHPTSIYISTHPAFYSPYKQAGFTFVNKTKYEEYKMIDETYCIEIGNDVWIGSDVIILGGVKIGDGAIIAAGATVSKNIPPYEIWGGNPIKKIKDRFTEKEKEELIKRKIWEKDFEFIKRNSFNFSSIERIKEIK